MLCYFLQNCVQLFIKSYHHKKVEFPWLLNALFLNGLGYFSTIVIYVCKLLIQLQFFIDQEHVMLFFLQNSEKLLIITCHHDKDKLLWSLNALFLNELAYFVTIVIYS
jgi:hypothetical protein